MTTEEILRGLEEIRRRCRDTPGLEGLADSMRDGDMQAAAEGSTDGLPLLIKLLYMTALFGDGAEKLTDGLRKITEKK